MLCTGLLPVPAAVLDSRIQDSNGGIRTDCLDYVYTLSPLALQELAYSSDGKSALQCWTLLSKHVSHCQCLGDVWFQGMYVVFVERFTAYTVIDSCVVLFLGIATSTGTTWLQAL